MRWGRWTASGCQNSFSHDAESTLMNRCISQTKATTTHLVLARQAHFLRGCSLQQLTPLRNTPVHVFPAVKAHAAMGIKKMFKTADRTILVLYDLWAKGRG